MTCDCGRDNQLAAAHMQIPTLSISCITNMAAGILDQTGPASRTASSNRHSIDTLTSPAHPLLVHVLTFEVSPGY